MVRHCLLVWLLGMLLALASAGAVLAEVKVIELRHRPASELAGAVAPLLSGEGSVSAYGGKLILKGSARELAEIEGVVRQLDLPRRTLRLTVRQSSSELNSGQQRALGGRMQAGDESGVEFSGSHQRTLGTGSRSSDQFLLLLDGEEGYIIVGQEVPFTSELAVLAGRHLAMAQRVDFRQVATGFRVRPQLLGESVQLEVTPQMSNLESRDPAGELTFSSLSSKVVFPLGQWFNLAGHLEGQDELSRALLSRQLGAGEARHQVYIRVDAGNNP